MDLDCLICKDSIGNKESVVLECSCPNSKYHVDCIKHWLKLNQDKTKCLNCFQNITNKQIYEIIGDYTKYNHYIKFYNFRLNKLGLLIYLVANLIYHLVTIINGQFSKQYRNELICQISSYHFLLVKIHLKIFIQLFTIEKSESKYFIVPKQQYLDFYHKNLSIISIYIGIIFMLSTGLNIYSYSKSITENKIDVIVGLIFLPVVFFI